MGQWVFKDKDGNTYDKVYVDGYHFGDRLMEGVVFEVSISKNNKFKCDVSDDDRAWLTENFNAPEWLKKCREFCEENDIFYSVPPGDDYWEHECWVVDSETGDEMPNVPTPTHPPVKIKAANIGDVLSKMTSNKEAKSQTAEDFLNAAKKLLESITGGPVDIKIAPDGPPYGQAPPKEEIVSEVSEKKAEEVFEDTVDIKLTRHEALNITLLLQEIENDPLLKSKLADYEDLEEIRAKISKVISWRD